MDSQRAAMRASMCVLRGISERRRGHDGRERSSIRIEVVDARWRGRCGVSFRGCIIVDD